VIKSTKPSSSVGFNSENKNGPYYKQKSNDRAMIDRHP